MNHRRYLALVAVTATGAAGCSSSAGFQHASDPWANEVEEDITGGTQVKSQLTLPEGTYAARELNPRLAVTFKMQVRADRPMDVFGMPDSEFERFREEDEWMFYPRPLRTRHRPVQCLYRYGVRRVCTCVRQHRLRRGQTRWRSARGRQVIGAARSVKLPRT